MNNTNDKERFFALIERVMLGNPSVEDLAELDAMTPKAGDIYLLPKTGRMLFVVEDAGGHANGPKLQVLTPGSDLKAYKMEVGDTFRSSCLDKAGWVRVSRD